MIIQKWKACVAPMQLSKFASSLKKLNSLYEKYNRTPWEKVHHELYGGHQVIMEREFPDIQSLDNDEKQSLIEEIRQTKIELLDSIVHGSVEITHYQTIEL